MTDISAALVKALREETNVGMMECKRALVEAGGDKAAAIKILRERGMAIAAKKSSRAANQGVIASALAADSRAGSLIEVNCETDFVAKNAGFRAFVQALAVQAAAAEGDLAVASRAQVTAKVAEIGENIVVRRSLRFERAGAGAIASYIHHGSTVGVLLELACGKPETAAQPAFREVAKDLCLQVAASSPRWTDRGAVPADVLAAERAIYAAQVKGKPPAIVDKIVNGKLNKFYEQVCLVDQPFIKVPEKTVAALLKETGAALGDTLAVPRFARFQVGEAI